MKRGLGDSYPCKPVEFRQGFGFGHHGLWQLRGLAEFMVRQFPGDWLFVAGEGVPTVDFARG